MKRTLLILLVMILTSPLAFSNAAVQQEVRLGTQVAATILGKYSQTSNAALIRYVNLVDRALYQPVVGRIFVITLLFYNLMSGLHWPAQVGSFLLRKA